MNETGAPGPDSGIRRDTATLSGPSSALTGTFCSRITRGKSLRGAGELLLLNSTIERICPAGDGISLAK